MLKNVDEDADLRAQVQESDPANWFCQYIQIHQLIVVEDILDGDLSTLDALPDEVEARLDVLGPAMEDQILAKLDRQLIVDVNGDGAWCSIIEAAE